MAKVIDISSEIGANISISDISTAHRLPSPSPREKPIIVRFSRRIAKKNIAQKEIDG